MLAQVKPRPGVTPASSDEQCLQSFSRTQYTDIHRLTGTTTERAYQATPTRCCGTTRAARLSCGFTYSQMGALLSWPMTCSSGFTCPSCRICPGQTVSLNASCGAESNAVCEGAPAHACARRAMQRPASASRHAWQVPFSGLEHSAAHPDELEELDAGVYEASSRHAWLIVPACQCDLRTSLSLLLGDKPLELQHVPISAFGHGYCLHRASAQVSGTAMPCRACLYRC